MDIKQQLKSWNREKWEKKNHAMYAVHGENQWPWFNDRLDPDVEEFFRSRKLRQLDILDLGTCSGSQAIALARKGHRLVGTDISETAIQQAKLALDGEQGLSIEFLLDDISASNLAENRFDLVLDRGCYHSICMFNHYEYVANIQRVLRRDGLLLLKTMSKEETRFVNYDKFADKLIQMPYHFEKNEILGLLSPHFKIEEIKDSFFYSSVTEPPAKALFLIIRNTFQ